MTAQTRFWMLVFGTVCVAFSLPFVALAQAIDVSEVIMNDNDTGFLAILDDNGDGLARADLSALGDINNDNIPDVFIGDREIAYILFGKADGAAVNLIDLQTGVGGFTIVDDVLDDGAFSIDKGAGAGDVNG